MDDEFEADEGLSGPADDTNASIAPPPPPHPKAANRKAKAKSKQKADKKSGRESYKGLQCCICERADCCSKNPYCAPCKTDVDAALKDSKEQGWREKFVECKKDPCVPQDDPGLSN